MKKLTAILNRKESDKTLCFLNFVKRLMSRRFSCSKNFGLTFYIAYIVTYITIAVALNYNNFNKIKILIYINYK